MKRLVLSVCCLALLGGAPLLAAGTGHGGSTHTTKTKTTTKTKKAKAAKARKPSTKKCQSCARDEKNRIKRSAAAKKSFMKATGYPKGRPGYVVDHIIPLACGGPDSPANMQWETTAEAAAKDRVERAGCTK